MTSPTIDWRSYPATMRAQHIADLYQRKVGGVKKAAQQGSPKIPTPCEKHPWGWNRDDVKRHFERRVADNPVMKSLGKAKNRKPLLRFVALVGEAIGVAPQDSEQTRVLREFARVMQRAVNE